MAIVNSLFPLKVLLVTLVTLTLLLAVHGYLGPRYGKREPDGSLRGSGRIRINGRSGQRNIQSRSQTRFYAGSRYGGKRSYVPASPAISDMENYELPSASNVPYDCGYVPYFGIRCVARQDESFWTSENEEEPMPSANAPLSSGASSDQ